MSISQANGADLLNLYSQSVGQGAVASAVTASVNVLKTAIAQAKLSASEIIAGNSDSGNQINLYA
jgi:hypothetical protein